MKRFKTIGVLGGMGIAATSAYLQSMIKYAQEKYGAVDDDDYPPMLINSLVVDGFDETGIVDPELVKSQLMKGVDTLLSGNVDLITIPCNTVHCFHSDLQANSEKPILHLVNLVLADLQKKDYKKPLILSSRTTREKRLYSKELEVLGIDFVEATDEEQDLLDASIDEIIGGSLNQDLKAKVEAFVAKYVEEEVDVVMLACTELPISYTAFPGVDIIDSIQVLAEASIDMSRQ